MTDAIFPGSTVRLIVKFLAQPVTYLSARVDNAAVTWPVFSNTGFPASAPFLVTAGREVASVTAGSSGTSWTVTRATEGIAQAHELGDTVVGQVLTSPTTVRVLVRNPAGATVAYSSTTAPAVSLASGSTGIYELQYPIPSPTGGGAEVGVYQFWGEGTGVVPDTAKADFVVVPGVST